MSRKEQRRPSNLGKTENLEPLFPKAKFSKKDLEQPRYLAPLDNLIRTMNAADLIKKGEPEQKLPTDKMGSDTTESTAHYLCQLKKNHDQLVKTSARKQVQTSRMRQEIDQIRRRLKHSSQSGDEQKKYVQEMEKKWEAVKLKQETTILASKTLEHMLDRMKKDQVIHQIRINELEDRVKELQGQVSEATQKNISLHEFQALSNMAVSSVRGSYEDARQQRKKQMEQFEGMLVRRKESDQREIERQRVTDEIQAMAASDLNDSDMIRWRKLMLVQKFFKKMLKVKLLNLEQKYSSVKDAFYTIKLRTNISDPNGLATSYFGLEETYQRLLQGVRHLEVRVETMEKQKSDLQKEYQGAKIDLLKVTRQREEKEDGGLARKAAELTDKSFQSELVQDRIHYWVVSSLYKLDSVNQRLSGSLNKYFESHQKQDLKQTLNDFCQQLYKSISDSKELKQMNLVPYQELREMEATTNRNQEEDSQDEEHVRKDYIKKATKKFS